MKLRPCLIAIVLIVVACGGDAADDDQPRNFSWRRVRVLVADAQTGQLALFDAEDEAVTHRFDVGAVPSHVQSSYGGDYGVIVANGGVRMLSAGVAIVDHTNHVHVYKSQPLLLPEAFAPSAPDHVVSNGAHMILGFANPSRHTLLMQTTPTPTVAAPVPMADMILPRLEGMLLVAGTNVSTLSFAGGEATPLGTLGACSQVVTYAASASRLALACDAGFVFSNTEASWAPSFLADARGAQAVQMFVHPANDTAVVRYDAGMMLTLSTQPAAVLANWDLPVGTCDVHLDPQSGVNLQVLTSSGELQVLSLQGVRQKRVAKVVPAFDCTAAVRPRFSPAPERAYVVDPRSADLIDVDLRKPRVVARYPVGGQPHKVAVLGIDPRNAGLRGPLPGEI